MPGNWTFVIVTDRKELDDQIYKTSASTTGVLTQQDVHAEDIQHLRQLLREDHRYIFTLIQKFQTKSGEIHPVLSERSDIIVITDEAHRSQYDTLALNMRIALPNAAFIAFTGTPLIDGEEKTKSVFGDYVSVYNFSQSIADGATVPLYYENRVPRLQLKIKGAVLNRASVYLNAPIITQSHQSQSTDRPMINPDAADYRKAGGNILPPLETSDTVPHRRTADPGPAG